MAALDSEYLKGTVGTVLSDGLAATVAMQPDDPVNFLAQYLLDSVAKEQASATLAKEVAEAKKAMQRKKDAEAVAAREAEQAATALATQREREDKRLAAHLDGAATADEVYRAMLSYLRTRMGVSAYVALTDLPEKAYVPPKPEEEGEAAPAAEEGYGAAAEEESEKPPAPPKYYPVELTYVAATGADEKLLVGKALKRAKKAEEEGEEEAAPTGDEGVSFVAVDKFLADPGTKPMHVEVAVTETVEKKAVKFWYIPRTGAYACAPFGDEDGDCKGILAADTLGLERAFSAEELEVLGELAKKTGETLARVEKTLGEFNYKATLELGEAYEGSRAELAKELEDAAAVEAEEGGDKLASVKAKYRRAAADVGSLTADKLTFIETRRSLKSDLLTVLKAVQAIIAPTLRPSLASMAWDHFKAAVASGAAYWGEEFFSQIGSFDVVASSDADGFATAATSCAEIDAEALKAESFLGFLLLSWVKDATALFEAKVEKEKADAAAAAAEAAPAAEE